MFMIVCVIDQPEHLSRVLHAWRDNGITGVTILESTGLHRFTQQPHIPMRYLFGKTEAEGGNVTLFTVVDQEEMIQRCLELTEAVVGDFNNPHTGIFTAWPLAVTKGITRSKPE